jgi:pyruvate ferredoxin oxidoreductase beta subunit/phenylglyoxylate dehydrogenase beta subunit
MNIVDFLAQTEDLVSPGISACQGCMAEHSLRTALKVLGQKTVIGVPPGCMAGAGIGGWNKTYGVKVASAMPQLGNSASIASGIKAAYADIDPDVHVVCYSGDGATADIGLQALSAAAERRDNIIYICNDNEGYMNTGFQKSGTTPYGASTSTTPVGNESNGKPSFKKDVAMMLAGQDAAYVATATPAYMNDLIAKLEKAAQVKEGLVYLHIFNPCPTGWGYDPAKSIEYSRLAVKSRYFLLYEYSNYSYKISGPSKNIKEPLSVENFLKGQKRFKHFESADFEVIQQYCDNKWKILSRLAD